MFRYRLRTLLILLAVGPMALAGLWAVRDNIIGRVVPLITELFIALGFAAIAFMFVVYAVLVVRWGLGFYRR